MIRVFGYGSLPAEPERPAALVEVVPARLTGWRRRFDKRSRPRGCPEAHARWPEQAPPDGFTDGPYRVSLALGLAPDGVTEGHLLTWDRDDVLADLDRREGYDPGDPNSGYRRARVRVETASGPVTAWTYVTNRSSPLYAPVREETVARVLVAATAARSPRATGVDYLEVARQALAPRTDPMLERVATRIAALLR